jgi:dihydrolipoamide dehydrogenase
LNSGAQKKIIVVGGGPGGYPAAIKAAQLGADVTLIDRDGLGGTCLHRGCIPTKYLLKAAKEYDTVKAYLKKHQQTAPPPDVAEMLQKKAEIISRLAGGTEGLLKQNGVRVLSGTASFEDAGSVRIEETGERLTASAFVVATGSENIRPPIEGIETAGVHDSDSILSIDRIPEHLCVIGGGYIGLEFAQIFQKLGSKVTVFEMMPRIMIEADAELSEAMQKILSADGIRIYTDTRVSRIGKTAQQLVVEYEKGGGPERMEADAVLSAVGRKPRTAGLGLANAGVRVAENGAIQVNSRLASSAPGIYAVGDAAGGIMLAHKATAEGECAAVNIVERPHEMAYEVVPTVMYTHPEMASVGLTEAQARQRYGEILVGRFPMAANGRAVLSGALKGFVKVIADMETEIVVGASFICPEAGHLIAEASLAIQMEATLEEVAETIHPHPTLSEAFREAAMDARGEAIHLPPE